MYKSSVAQLLRSDITKQDANQFIVGTIISVNSESRMASVYFGSKTVKINNVIVLDDVNIADIVAGSDALILKLTGSMYIMLGTISAKTGKSIEMYNFDGGLKVGMKNSHLPNATFTSSTGISTYEIKEIVSSDEYGNESYTYEHTYIYGDEEVTLAEDIYAGEIRRFGNKLYSWCETYEAPYTTYNLNPEWVGWDDSRYIRGVPVSFESPTDGQILGFNQAYGMYRPITIDTDLQDHDHSGDTGDGGQLEATDVLLSTDVPAARALFTNGDDSVSWSAIAETLLTVYDGDEGDVLTVNADQQPIWSPPAGGGVYVGGNWTDTDAEITDATNWQNVLSVTLTLAEACNVAVSGTWNTSEISSGYGTYWRIARGTTQVSNTVCFSDDAFRSGAVMGGESSLSSGTYTWYLQAKRRLSNNVTLDSCGMTVIATKA